MRGDGEEARTDIPDFSGILIRMTADGPQLPLHSAEYAVDMLLDSGLLTEMLAGALPGRGGEDAFFHRLAVDLLNALAHAAASGDDAVAILRHVRHWLSGDLVEPAVLLDQAGKGRLALHLTVLQTCGVATLMAVKFSAVDILETLRRVAIARINPIVGELVDGTPVYIDASMDRPRYEVEPWSNWLTSSAQQNRRGHGHAPYPRIRMTCGPGVERRSGPIVRWLRWQIRAGSAGSHCLRHVDLVRPARS